MRTLLSPALASALALAAAALSSCTSDDASARELAAATGARARVAPKVRTEPVVQREMVRYLETTTVLESEFDIDLFARRSGEVIEVLVEEGDQVDAGQILARLDDLEERLAVDEAEVALEEAENAASRAKLAVQEARARAQSARLAAEQAERDFARDQRLHSGKDVASALSQQALETSRLNRDNMAAEHEQAEIAVKRSELEEQNARTTVRKSQVALERARVALEEMQLTAPFYAVVAQRNIRLGDSVGSGEFAFKLTDPLQLRAVFNRPQRELALFQGGERTVDDSGRQGLELTAVAEAIPGRVFKGQVARVSPTIDPLSGNFRVTAYIEGAEDEEHGPTLLPGMLLRLKIATERHPGALVVPKRAVRREGDTSTLLVVEDSKLREVVVVEGFTDNDNVEVTPKPSGALAAGDQVVVVGNRDLDEGTEVVIDDLGAGAAAEPVAEADDAELKASAPTPADTDVDASSADTGSAAADSESE